MFSLETEGSFFANCDSLIPEMIDGKYTGFQVLTFDKTKKTKIKGDYLITKQ